MSIAIIIDNPTTEAKKRFYVPVATEETFQTYWMSAAEALALAWVPLFKTGVFIELEDAFVIIKEILLVREWVTRNVTDLDRKSRLKERIDFIIETVSTVFEEEGVKLYIG